MREKRQRRLPSTVIVLDAMGNKHAVTAYRDDGKELVYRLRSNHPANSSADGFIVDARGFDVDLFVRRANETELKFWKPQG